ncbi:MAG TPA: hypothetical protein VFG76_10705 [Candidatus Polarisedimenticolia bacterium]|nr:hypothetical protein [Candidatus Polarisedimenticolia bacterium]
MAVQITPGTNATPVATNGTTPVEIVPAPAAGVTRIVLSIVYDNQDTTDHQATLNKVIAAADHRIWHNKTVSTESTEVVTDRDNVIMLDDTMSLEFVLGEAKATLDGEVEVSWIDREVV